MKQITQFTFYFYLGHDIRRLLVLTATMLTIISCSNIQSSISEDMAQTLSAGISNQSDIELVKAGIPSYLLMIDGMILEDSENPDLYMAGAKLYSTIANFVEDDIQRSMQITDKAYRYSEKLLCLTEEDWCELSKHTFEDYRRLIEKIDADNVDLLYIYGATWASYIEAHKSDWEAIADLPKVKATMLQVLKMNELYDQGGAHLYLGVMEGLIPPALGGKLDVAKSHFERVIEITKGRHLMAKVMYAEYYARVLYNRELHDRLLNDVLTQDPVEKGLTLANVVAQKRAKILLGSAEDYF